MTPNRTRNHFLETDRQELADLGPAPAAAKPTVCGRFSPEKRVFHPEQVQVPLPNPCKRCQAGRRTRKERALRPLRRRKTWTKEDHDVIRREYDHTRQSKEHLAHKLGTTYNAVHAQIGLIGLAKSYDRRPWTKEDDDRLEQFLPNLSINTAAKRLKRTVSSVSARARRLKLSRRDRHNWYTLEEVSQILGAGAKWVKKRIDQGALKATKHHPIATNRSENNTWHIAKADLKAYIRRYPQELIGRNIDVIQFVDILAGIADPEPAQRRS